MSATIVCPNCGFADNPATTRFCGNCASRLPSPCPVCGAVNPQGFRFCGQCAAPLQRTVPLQSIHRVVSVLFIDICNSTAFTHKLGMERMYLLLDACLRQLSLGIRRFEGTIDKFMGDGFMAVFGMPTTLEQHAVQAAYATLAVMEELAIFNQQALASDDISFDIRIGMASGEAVSGGLGSDRAKDVTVVGEVVNLAARLQQNAEPGTIVLDEQATYLVRPLFNLTTLPPQMLKGFPDPVVAYRLEGKRHQPGRLRGLAGQLTPLVGRQSELEQLEQAIQPLTEGVGGAVWLTGEAGMGKSRLTNEVLTRLKDEGLRTLEGDCFSHTRTVPYNAFIGVVRDFCAILPTDDRETTRQKIHQAVARLPVGEQDVVPYLEYLLSIDLVDEALLERVRHLEPAQLKRQLFSALREVLLAESQQNPLVLVLDDLQWADELSAELITFLAQSLAQAPILLHLIARGEYQPYQRLMFAAVMDLAGERATFLHLTPMGANEQQQMAHSLLPGAEVTLIERLVRHAEGNPYYLEELARNALDAPESGEGEGVPASLEALIRARYDRLPEALQSTLAKAAVIGRRFPMPLLQAVQGESTQETLNQLHQRGFVRPRRGNEDEWAFLHILTQETVYKSLLERERRSLHEQVAEALERIAGDRLDEQVSLLAFHFSRSNDTTKAIHYLLLAASRAAGRFANEEALRLYEEAATFLRDAGSLHLEPQVALHAGRGDVLALTGKYDEARLAYEQALALLPMLAEPGRTSHTSLERRLAGTYEKQNRYDAARQHLALARQALPPDESDEQARLDSDEGWVAFLVGELEKAEQHLRAALAEGDRAIQARVYNRLAGIHFRRGELEQAKEMLVGSLAVSREVNDQRSVALTLGNLGNVAYSRSQWGEAADYFFQSRDICLRNGDAEGEARAMLNAAAALIMSGELARANEILESAYALMQEMDIRFLMLMVRINQGRVHFYTGDLDAARACFVEAWRLHRTIHGLRAHASDIVELLGRIALLQQRRRMAWALANKALRLAEANNAPVERFRALRLLALVCSEQGEVERADALLAELEGMRATAEQYEIGLYLLARATHAERQGLGEEAARLRLEASETFAAHHIAAVVQRVI